MVPSQEERRQLGLASCRVNIPPDAVFDGVSSSGLRVDRDGECDATTTYRSALHTTTRRLLAVDDAVSLASVSSTSVDFARSALCAGVSSATDVLLYVAMSRGSATVRVRNAYFSCGSSVYRSTTVSTGICRYCKLLPIRTVTMGSVSNERS